MIYLPHDHFFSQTFANRTLGVMAWIMPVFVICSTFGSSNGVIFTQSRLIFAAARKGHFPEALSLVNLEHVTPMPAIMIHVRESLVINGVSKSVFHLCSDGT